MSGSATVQNPSTDSQSERAQIAVDPHGYKIGSNVSEYPVHQKEDFTTSASEKTLDYLPSQGIRLEANADCWVRFDGEAATADMNSVRIAANVPYTDLGKGATSMSVIGNSGSGSVQLHYHTETQPPA